MTSKEWRHYIRGLAQNSRPDDMENVLLIDFEAAEATCQSLREQSSRWEAQALEAGMRIAELEAQVRGLREIADQWDADKETLLRGWFAAALIRAALAKPQEVKT